MSTDRVLNAARIVRGLVRGPVGCLLVLLLLPLVLVAFLLLLLFAPKRTVVIGGAPRPGPGPMPRGRPTALPVGGSYPPAEEALRELVRGLALDESFTREEALATPIRITAADSPGVAELLDEGLRRGWIEQDGERLRVTDDGRRDCGA